MGEERQQGASRGRSAGAVDPRLARAFGSLFETMPEGAMEKHLSKEWHFGKFMMALVPPFIAFVTLKGFIQYQKYKLRKEGKTDEEIQAIFDSYKQTVAPLNSPMASAPTDPTATSTHEAGDEGDVDDEKTYLRRMFEEKQQSILNKLIGRETSPEQMPDSQVPQTSSDSERHRAGEDDEGGQPAKDGSYAQDQEARIARLEETIRALQVERSDSVDAPHQPPPHPHEHPRNSDADDNASNSSDRALEARNVRANGGHDGDTARVVSGTRTWAEYFSSWLTTATPSSSSDRGDDGKS